MSPIGALGARLETDVLAARAGDALAFGRLVDETKSAVTAIALAIVGDFPASQDIAQDVFFAAWRNLGKLRSPSSFLPWLRQTTRNRARTWLRDQGRRRLAGTQIDQLLPEVAGAGPDPSDLLVEREERRLVVEAFADLPDDAREVVILYYREGQSVAQVAYLLELTSEAVRQRLSRSRRRMRETVAERLGQALSRTAPGAAFTTAVLTGLITPTPAVAASVAMGTASKVAAATPFVVKLAAAIGGIVVGASGGIIGFLLGLRWEFRKADTSERRRLRWFAATGVGLVLGTSVGFNLSGPSSTWIGPALIYLAFGLGLWLMLFVWLPRINGPRLAAERAADPDAAGRQRRHGRMKRVGFVGGVLAGGAGLIAGMFKSGLLP